MNEMQKGVSHYIVGIWVAMILVGSLVLYLSPQEVIQEDKSCVNKGGKQ